MRFFLEHKHGSVELTSGVTVVGRGPECQLQFNDESLSRQHCRFILSTADLILEDMKSRNGTFVNGRPLPGRRRVFPGDRVIVGQQEIMIATAEGGLDRPPTAEYPHWNAAVEPNADSEASRTATTIDISEEEAFAAIEAAKAAATARKAASTVNIKPGQAPAMNPRDTIIDTAPDEVTGKPSAADDFDGDDFDEVTELDKLVCPACGAEIALNITACTKCGAPLK